MKIEYIRAKNFLAIGNEEVEIKFDELGKIILINGKNFDYSNDQLIQGDDIKEFHSNASMKSGLSEVLVYGLYGNTIRKRVTHTDVIHNKTGKHLEVEVIFKMGEVRYRIIRTRKPDSLRLWQNGPGWDELTLGGSPATQTRIEEILGMNHKAFVNVVYFGQHNDYNFLECTAADQRQIAESLLSLEDFKNYCEQAKGDTKEIKTQIKELTAAYEQICAAETNGASRIEQIKRKKVDWENNCQKEIETLGNRYKFIETQLASTDMGSALLKYEQAQVDISSLHSTILKKNEQESALETALNQAKTSYDTLREKLHELNLSFRSAKQDLTDRLKEQKADEEGIEKLEMLPQGSQCPHCYGVIDKQHYRHVTLLHKNRIEAVAPKINLAKTNIQQLDGEIKKIQESQSKIESLKNTASIKLKRLAEETSQIKLKINELSRIQRPDLSCDEMVLKERLVQIENNINIKKDELARGGPYVEILTSAEKDLEDTRKQKEEYKIKLNELDESLSYYEWWTHGFDDIRSFIIERIIPALNARIAMWLDYLIQGKIKVTFDKHLNAKIESLDGDIYTYFAMCGSEKKRINLAISQSFAYIMMLSSGTWPSVVFLDEVSESIDQRGVCDIYKMICELSNEKQVFIITHNVDLRKMLDGVDTITMVRENGQSRLEK